MGIGLSALVGDAADFEPTTLAVGRVASRFSVRADNDAARGPDNVALEARGTLAIGGGVVITIERGADVAFSAALIAGGLRGSLEGAAAAEAL